MVARRGIEALKKWRDENKGKPVSKAPWTGLSRKRAMDALCYECNNGSPEDCEAPWCSLYAFRKSSKLNPSLWWLRARRLWKYAVRGGYPRGPGEAVRAIQLGKTDAYWWRT